MKTSIIFQIVLFITVFVNSALKSQTSNADLTITGPLSLCETYNTFVKYKVNSEVGVYNWKLPQGLTIYSGQGTNKIMVSTDYSFTNGWIIVERTDNGDLATDSLYVDILPIAPIFNQGMPQILHDEIVRYSVKNSGDYFNWTAPYGAVILDGQGTNSVRIKFSQSFQGGDIEVYSENNCGISQNSSYRVDVRPVYNNTSIGYTQTKTGKLNLQAKSNISTETNKFGTLAGDVIFHDNLTQATFRDTVKQGDIYYFEVVVKNQSSNPMDSFYLKYYVGDDDLNYGLVMVRSLAPGESYTIPVLQLPTVNLLGNQYLNLELNPNNEKPETNYNNNKLSVPFFIRNIFATNVVNVERTDAIIYNYPNPVADATQFYVNLGSGFSETENISIHIFDISGRNVKTLICENNNGDGEFNTAAWDATDASNNKLSSGNYFYTVIAKNNKGETTLINSKSNIQIVK